MSLKNFMDIFIGIVLFLYDALDKIVTLQHWTFQSMSEMIFTCISLCLFFNPFSSDLKFFLYKSFMSFGKMIHRYLNYLSYVWHIMKYCEETKISQRQPDLKTALQYEAYHSRGNEEVGDRNTGTMVRGCWQFSRGYSDVGIFYSWNPTMISICTFY